MFSVHLYKIWYIVTAFSLFTAGIFVLLGILNTDKLFRSTCCILIYFGYLLLSSFWSISPGQTVKFFFIDSIEIVVFILFYILVLNISLAALTKMFIYLVFPGFFSAVLFYYLDPNSIRIGSRSLTILPMALPFVWMYYFTSMNRDRYVALFSGVTIIALLFISMSRTPLAVGVVLTILSIGVFGKLCSRYIIKILSVGLAFLSSFLILWQFETTRFALIKTYVRIFHRDFYGGTTHIAAETVDKGRELISRGISEIVFTNQPFGMGYMNFPVWSGDVLGKSKSLHNIYWAWWIEGGVSLVLIVGFIFTCYFYSLLKCIVYSTDIFYRNFCFATIISMVGVLLYGLYHQIHQVPTMYMLLGVGFALSTLRKQSCSNTLKEA